MFAGVLLFGLVYLLCQYATIGRSHSEHALVTRECRTAHAQQE